MKATDTQCGPRFAATRQTGTLHPMTRKPRFAVLAEGQFGTLSSKTANSVIRYSGDHVVAVIDSAHAGKTVGDVLGFGHDVPIVASVADAAGRGANALVIGIAPPGGRLPVPLRFAIQDALANGWDVWSGLHTFLADDAELADLAKKRGGVIHDVRRPPPDLPVGSGRVRELDATVVLAVGADANIGKMTAMLQVRDAMRARGERVGFAPTGQTGILIEGWGICVDAVVADFVAGASERLTMQAALENDIVLVEGQGSILHPGYSAVSLGLLHGSLPHALIMCHQPTRQTFRHNEWLRIPPLPEIIQLHEAIVAPLRPARTIAVSLNTYDLSDADARRTIDRIAEETGLPTTDPVRFSVGPLVDAIGEFHRKRRGAAAA